MGTLRFTFHTFTNTTHAEHDTVEILKKVAQLKKKKTNRKKNRAWQHTCTHHSYSQTGWLARLIDDASESPCLKVGLKDKRVTENYTMDFHKFCKRHKLIGFSFYGITTSSHKGSLHKHPIALPSDWTSITKNTIHKEHKAFAVRTGQISGVTVIDADNVNVYNRLIRDYPALSDTLTIQTPRGFHIYCKYDSRLVSNTNSFASYPNVDIRSDGAIVFAPFTTYRNCITGKTETYTITNPTRRLIEIPQALVDDVQQRTRARLKTTRDQTAETKEPTKESPTSATEPMEPTNDLETISRLIKALPLTYLASYNTWLRTGAIIHHESNGSQSGKELFLQVSRLAPGYESVGDKEIENAWQRYARRTGVLNKRKATIATLYYDLKAYNEDEFYSIVIPKEPMFLISEN